MKLGIVHPGAMGAAIGECAAVPVVWASAGRSDETRKRAESAEFQDVVDLGNLVDVSEVIVSVCPSHAAIDVARSVREAGFAGIYVDANAVSPETANQIGTHFERFVDGGIIGRPPHSAGTTRLYLSGEDADDVATLWEGSNLETRVLSQGGTAASALKVAYAGWSKGSAALLIAMRAYAEALGVGVELVEEWAISIPGLGERLLAAAERTGPKAWRFKGEMEEIAKALEDAGLPGGFHDAAAVLYGRLEPLRATSGPTVDEILQLLLEG